MSQVEDLAECHDIQVVPGRAGAGVKKSDCVCIHPNGLRSRALIQISPFRTSGRTSAELGRMQLFCLVHKAIANLI